MTTTTADPFGTARLREAVLRAWQDSPTRFTEDTNAETDLRVGGYRDRLFVELAQNAADAALAAGRPGTVRVSVVDGELRFANTGEPLDARGVESLASLRASGKRVEETVGRFGVGFAAVLTVSGAPRVVSTSGGVAFSEDRTREAAERAGEVPVLRLPWPITEEEPLVPQGFDTEVRLPLRDDVDAKALLDNLATDLPDLLLALPWLARVEVGDQTWTRAELEGGVVEIGSPAGSVRWLTHTGDAVWAIPVDADGIPRPLGEDVLHAPTPTDDKLTLPARLIASLPLEPSRRRVLPGAPLTAALESVAAEYVGLVRAVAPQHRLLLVPSGGFPRSTVDGSLRELLLDTLRENPWLPAQSGAEVSGARARVLVVESTDLPPLLPALVPGLLASPLCGPAAVTVLGLAGAQPLTAAELIEILTGIDRAPGWWRSLYDTLLPLLESHAFSSEDLGGLPVPMSDGRTLPGVRDALLVGGSAELLELLSDVDIIGLRLVHPEAAHPLLERLGAKHAEARDLLAADPLREAVERSVEDARSGLDGTDLAGATLRLVAETGNDAPEWIGALALPCDDGWRRADELVLPGSPLRELFDPEVFDPEDLDEVGAMSILADEFAEDWPTETLVAAGVLDTFAVIVDEEPVEPEHNLPEEHDWWDSAERPPTRVLAVRDLDLVADDAWPAALKLLASRPETLAALREPRGHARWWLARYALLAGRLPGEWRLPEATALTGLYDEVPELGLSRELLATIGVRADLTLLDADDVEDLLDRLGDSARKVTPGLASRAHTALAKSEVDFHGLDAPARVRAVDGTVADADAAVVLDVPWPVAVLPPGRLVSAASDLTKLAEVLDLPLASGLVAEVTSESEYAPWAELAAVGLAAELTGVAPPEGGVLVHEVLTVSFEGVEHEVPWWFDGRLHASDTSEGLARAYAWAAERWGDRFLLAALLEDPSAVTLLG